MYLEMTFPHHFLACHYPGSRGSLRGERSERREGRASGPIGLGNKLYCKLIIAIKAIISLFISQTGLTIGLKIFL
jgi:hypothetical protein